VEPTDGSNGPNDRTQDNQLQRFTQLKVLIPVPPPRRDFFFCMTIREITDILEEWAPRWMAWEKDSVGLQVGDASRPARRILVTLDVTPAVVREAISRRTDLIVAHHPLLFRPPSSITTADDTGRLILECARRRIAVYAAHTNLDFTRGGVNTVLAHRIGIDAPRFLSPLKGTLAKIAVFVPDGHVERLREAMTEAGAGVIGAYSACAFTASGRGTFRGSDDSNPFVGKPGRLEEVPETRLEMLAPRAKVEAVLRAVRAVHPYDEVAYDVYPLENLSTVAGMGAIGELAKPEPVKRFLERIRRTLKADALRHTEPVASRIKTVAMSSGSGSDQLHEAIQAGADAFITADVRYHTFQSAAGRILLIDAGHWETEQLIVPVIADRLRTEAVARRTKIEVVVSRQSINPIRWSTGPAVA
jgi:dinuclear metal center YbgI/SA1388 family protein